MTTPTASEMLAKYLAAESAVLQGREFQFEGRRVTMSDLPEIRNGRKEWERRVSSERSRAAGAPTIGGLGYSVARLN